MKKIGLLFALLLAISLLACSQVSSPSLSEPASSEEAAGNLQTVVFPAYTDEKTQYNASIFEIPPFTLSVELPEGWTIHQKGEGDTAYGIAGAWSGMGIYDADQQYVGAVAYNTYEEYEGAEDTPQAIYNQIALANHYSFNAQPADTTPGGAYVPVKETSSGVTATTEVYLSAIFNQQAGYGDTETYNKGILSYNKERLVYVAFEFASDALTDEQLTQIAQSVEIL